MEEYLTVDEIAKNLGMNPISIRRWIHAGHLPATKFLKEFRINKKDFEKFLASRKVKK